MSSLVPVTSGRDGTKPDILARFSSTLDTKSTFNTHTVWDRCFSPRSEPTKTSLIIGLNDKQSNGGEITRLASAWSVVPTTNTTVPKPCVGVGPKSRSSPDKLSVPETSTSIVWTATDVRIFLSGPGEPLVPSLTVVLTVRSDANT